MLYKRDNENKFKNIFIFNSVSTMFNTHSRSSARTFTFVQNIDAPNKHIPVESGNCLI